MSVGIVQLDAVVTDGKGRHVTDLGPDDFVVKEGREAREISHVLYVPLASHAATPGDAAAPAVSSPLALPATRPRLISLVVDDLNLSFESTIRVKEALRRLVAEVLSPTDQVAIVRTGGGVGTMQQFTSDRRRLDAAVDRVRFNPIGVARITATEAIDTEMPFGGGPTGGSPSGRSDRKETQRQGDVRRAQFIAVGSMGTLRAVIRSLAPLAGRKAVVFFSDGLSYTFGDDERRIESTLSGIVDEANRASVTLYTIDTRALFNTGLKAEDNLASSTSPLESSRLLAQRAMGDLTSRMGMRDMAERTGGFTVTHGNDIAGGVANVIADQQGYYLIGFVPPQAGPRAEDDRPRFHELQVSVRRPGLRVRARSGFYGVREADAPPPTAPIERLRTALLSPFAAADLGVRLQAVFLDDEKAGPSLRALLHLDGRDLTFTEAEGGGRQAALEVVAVTFGEGGQPVDEKSQTFHVRGPAGGGPPEDLDVFYSVDLPVKRPGPYQFRVVVRDRESDRLGAASQFVDVPEVGKGRLALSGIIVRSEGGPGAAGAAETLVGRVRPGRTVEYVFQILNARRDPAGKTRLSIQARLWRDRDRLYEGAPTSLSLAPADPRRIAAAGRLGLSPRLPPGDYLLEVSVTDTLAKRGQNVVRESVDLEVVRE